MSSFYDHYGNNKLKRQRTRRICLTCIDSDVDLEFHNAYCFKKHSNIIILEDTCPDWERTASYVLKRREKLGIPLKETQPCMHTKV